MSQRKWVRRVGEKVWKWIARLAVLVMVILLPVSAVAHTKLFYRMSCKSDYRKVEVVTPEPTLTPIPTETPTEVPTPILVVEIIDSEGAEEPSDQISTPSDLATTQKFPPTVLRQWMS